MLNDAKEEFVTSRIAFIDKLLAKDVAKGKKTEEEKAAILSLIKPATDLSVAKDVDLIIEAIIENLGIKTQLIKQLNDIVSDECIFASNTSSLPITELAAAYKKPENLSVCISLILVPVMTLIELIRGIATSDETYNTVAAVAEKINKVSVMVKDVPGFAVNRILITMINEAISAVETGVASIEDIDEAMKRGQTIRWDLWL